MKTNILLAGFILLGLAACTPAETKYESEVRTRFIEKCVEIANTQMQTAIDIYGANELKLDELDPVKECECLADAVVTYYSTEGVHRNGIPDENYFGGELPKTEDKNDDAAYITLKQGFENCKQRFK